MTEAKLTLAEMVMMVSGCWTPAEVMLEKNSGRHVMVPRSKKAYSNRESVESNRSGTDLELATGGDQPRITARQAAKTTLDVSAGMQVRASNHNKSRGNSRQHSEMRQ